MFQRTLIQLVDAPTGSTTSLASGRLISLRKKSKWIDRHTYRIKNNGKDVWKFGEQPSCALCHVRFRYKQDYETHKDSELHQNRLRWVEMMNWWKEVGQPAYNKEMESEWNWFETKVLPIKAEELGCSLEDAKRIYARAKMTEEPEWHRRLEYPAAKLEIEEPRDHRWPASPKWENLYVKDYQNIFLKSMNIVLPPIECGRGRNVKVALNANEPMHNKYQKNQVSLESNSASKLTTQTRNYSVSNNTGNTKTANNNATYAANFHNHATQPANTDLAETGYMHLIRSIRQQFLHPSSTSEPLLLAPQIPSIIRSNTPQTTSFADLINLYKRVHHNVPFQSVNAVLPNERRISGVALTQSGNQLAAPRGARKRSMNSILAQGEHFISGGSGDDDAFAILNASKNINNAGYNNNNLYGDGTAKNCKESENQSMNSECELYSAKAIKTLPAIRNASILDDKIKHSTFHAMTSKVHETNMQSSSKLNGKVGVETKMQSIQPLLQCHTFSDKCLVLTQIESMHRLELIRNEQWERQLAQKYMTVNYIDHILRPEMEELSQMEREERTELIEQETFERNANLSSSMEWCSIESGIRALIAKQIKLARLSKYDSQLRKLKHRTYEPHSNNKSESGVDVHNGAKDAVNNNYNVEPTHRASSSVVKTKTECVANDLDENDEVLDARRILERYLHERANYALGRVESIRRLSKLPQLESLSAALASSFNPPQGHNETNHLSEVCSVAGSHINSTKAQSARPPLSSPVSSHTQWGSTVGLASYTLLLDQDKQIRQEIEFAQECEWKALMRLFAEEQEKAREWLRKRLHLERLVYWRNQRERQLEMELEALTKVKQSEAEFNDTFSQHIRNVVCEEQTSRAAIDVEAHKMYELLYCQHNECQYTLHYTMLFQQETVHRGEIENELCALYMEELENYEKMWRRCIEETEKLITAQTIYNTHADLCSLLCVSSNELKMHAIVLLQRTWKTYKAGKLGWRYTHRQVAREITTARNNNTIQRGIDALNELKSNMEREAQSIQNEICASFQHALQSVCTEEEQERSAIRKEELSAFILVKAKKYWLYGKQQRAAAKGVHESIAQSNTNRTMEAVLSDYNNASATNTVTTFCYNHKSNEDRHSSVHNNHKCKDYCSNSNKDECCQGINNDNLNKKEKVQMDSDAISAFVQNAFSVKQTWAARQANVHDQYVCQMLAYVKGKSAAK